MSDINLSITSLVAPLAENISVTDTGGYYAASDVEGALIENAPQTHWWRTQALTGIESAPRALCSASVTMTSGTLRLAYFTADRTISVSNVRLGTGSTAAGATPTVIRVGLYTVDSSDNITLAASTANDTSLLASTSTLYTKALSSSYELTLGRRYALGLLVVTAATAPTVFGVTPNLNAINALAPRIVMAQTGLSDLPTSTAIGSLVTTTAIPWIGLTA